MPDSSSGSDKKGFFSQDAYPRQALCAQEPAHDHHQRQCSWRVHLSPLECSGLPSSLDSSVSSTQSWPKFFTNKSPLFFLSCPRNVRLHALLRQHSINESYVLPISGYDLFASCTVSKGCRPHGQPTNLHPRPMRWINCPAAAIIAQRFASTATTLAAASPTPIVSGAQTRRYNSRPSPSTLYLPSAPQSRRVTCDSYAYASGGASVFRQAVHCQVIINVDYHNTMTAHC